MRVAIRIVAAVFVLAGAHTASAQNGEANSLRGQDLYYEYACYGCHGYNGQAGRLPLVERLGGGVLASETTFIRFLRLRADANPLLPSTSMPNYPESSLSDSQARDIYAFIRTFEDTAPEAEDIPLFEMIVGSTTRSYDPAP